MAGLVMSKGRFLGPIRENPAPTAAMNLQMTISIVHDNPWKDDDLHQSNPVNNV